jgi:hypothetical protein
MALTSSMMEETAVLNMKRSRTSSVTFLMVSMQHAAQVFLLLRERRHVIGILARA